MHADGVGVHWHFGAVDREDFVVTEHAEDTIRRLDRIVQERLRMVARDERAIPEIVAVREHFANDGQLVCFRRAGQGACRVSE